MNLFDLCALHRAGLRRGLSFLLLVSMLLIAAGCEGGVFPAEPQDSMPPSHGETNPPLGEGEEEKREFRHFQEMVYEAPDAEHIEKRLTELAQNVETCADLQALKEIETEAEAMVSRYSTMYALANIYASRDMSNTGWVEEKKRLSENGAKIDMASNKLLRAFYDSPFKEEIEAQWDEDYFLYIRDTEFVNEVTQPLFTRIATLTNEHNEMLNMGTVTFRGEDLTINEIYALDSYEAWLEANQLWFSQYNPKLGGMYLELVSLRQQIARELGFDTYTDMAFYLERKDYTPEMLAVLLDEIETEIVPVFTQLSMLGKYWPDVQIPYDKFLSFVERTFEGISPDINEALSAMMEYGLYDLLPHRNKEQGAYVIYLTDYMVPFLMGSFEEDSSSVTMVLHELGHFYSDFVLQDEASGVNDITEIHSQALELLLSDHYQEEFGETEGFMMQYDILHNAITTMVVQPYYAAIELRVYGLGEEELTLENINRIAREEGERFGQINYYEGYLDNSWILMPHIVNRPYSTLAYATSMSVALQILEEYWRDSDAAIEAYEKIVHLEGGDTFLENVAHANLLSPFAPGRMKQMADFARKYLLQEEDGLEEAA